MGKHTKWDELKLKKYTVPSQLVALYDELQAANSDAIQSVKNGEAEPARHWRLASRICREFLRATEEPAQLALASGFGDWEKARRSDTPPDDPYTYWLWLAAQAWRLLRCCRAQEGFIEAIRHCAREGIIAVKTSPSLQRVVAQREVNGESQIDDRERGPALKPAGTGPSVRLEI